MNETTLAVVFTVLLFLCLYYVDEFRAVVIKSICIFLLMIIVGWFVGVISAAIICVDTGDLPWYAQYLGIFN